MEVRQNFMTFWMIHKPQLLGIVPWCKEFDALSMKRISHDDCELPAIYFELVYHLYRPLNCKHMSIYG